MQQPIFIRFERLLIKIWGKYGESRKFEYRQAAERTLTTEYRHRIMQDKGERKMFDEKEIAYLQEMEERITRSMAVLIESDVTPKFNLLADGIKDIQEKLVPRSRMDDLEDEVKFLKLMCRQMAEDIAKLKKAN